MAVNILVIMKLKLWQHMTNSANINESVEVAIIGGTGVYDPGLMANAKRIKVYTPYGSPSALITIGTYAGKRIAFLPRHGDDHSIPPGEINYRANLWALNSLGVKRIVAPCAVGSLCEDIHPGDIVVADQFFDFTKGRLSTFYEGGQVCHISVAEPFCPELRSTAISVLKDMQVKFHSTGTNVCIQGPRFSTKAESEYFRKAVGGHIIGMTLVPECVLARELEICYLSFAAVTDYDSWKEDSHVDAGSVKKIMSKNIHTIRMALQLLLPKIPEKRDGCRCGFALQDALM